MGFKYRKTANEYARKYYVKNRVKLLEYQKKFQMNKREYDKEYSLRALKAWRTRRENEQANPKKELLRLNKEIQSLEMGKIKK